MPSVDDEYFDEIVAIDNNLNGSLLVNKVKVFALTIDCCNECKK